MTLSWKGQQQQRMNNGCLDTPKSSVDTLRFWGQEQWCEGLSSSLTCEITCFARALNSELLEFSYASSKTWLVIRMEPVYIFLTRTSLRTAGWHRQEWIDTPALSQRFNKYNKSGSKFNSRWRHIYNVHERLFAGEQKSLEYRGVDEWWHDQWKLGWFMSILSVHPRQISVSTCDCSSLSLS